MFVTREKVTITTDASGDATVYTGVVSGRVLAIRLVIPGSGGLDSGVDLTITGEDTGTAILTLTNQGGSSATYYPRAGVCGPTGTALTYDGTRTVNEPVVISGERIKCVVAQGGNTLAGTLHYLIG